MKAPSHLKRMPDRANRTVEERAGALDWLDIRSQLSEAGAATTCVLLSQSECAELRWLYEDAERFRSRVVMARHGFGRGEYQYLSYPLPPVVQSLRAALYERLAPIANEWMLALGVLKRFPKLHSEYAAICHEAGQTKPTPLILKYEAGDYNCLHQDIYGELVFPFQVAFLLSQPREDFTGGEFVLTEQRPRMQSRAEVVTLRQGEGAIFPVRERPVQGARGIYKTAMRHGVSRVKSGARFTLGVIFHDAA